MAAVMAAAGCRDRGTTAPDTDAGGAAVAAAVGVLAAGCSPSDDEGRGAMIDTDLAVTAAHVVAGATNVRVVDWDGAHHAAEVVLFDPDLDVAVLRTSRPIGTPLRITEPAVTGDRGIVVRDVGEPGAPVSFLDEVEVIRTVDIATTDIYLERDVTRPGFEVDATVEPGDSGSVVVLPGGIVGGDIWARSNRVAGRAWAIDLPATLADAELRAALTEPVDIGDCAP